MSSFTVKMYPSNLLDGYMHLDDILSSIQSSSCSYDKEDDQVTWFHVVKPEWSSLGLCWWEMTLQIAKLTLKLQSIGGLDGMWNYDSTLTAKKTIQTKKHLGSSLPITKWCPLSVLEASFLTPIYRPGRRFHWNRFTVVPLSPRALSRIDWVTTNVHG